MVLTKVGFRGTLFNDEGEDDDNEDAEAKLVSIFLALLLRLLSPPVLFGKEAAASFVVVVDATELQLDVNRLNHFM